MEILLYIFLYLVTGMIIFSTLEKIDRYVVSLEKEPLFYTIESKYHVWCINYTVFYVIIIFWPVMIFAILLYISYLFLRKLFKLP